jgi:hypothetical protein
MLFGKKGQTLLQLTPIIEQNKGDKNMCRLSKYTIKSCYHKTRIGSINEKEHITQRDI